MVANGTHDPPTPLVNALSVWLQIPDARLLIANVDGHQSLVWSPCAFELFRGSYVGFSYNALPPLMVDGSASRT